MIYFIIAAIIVIGDQFFKYWICANIAIDGTKDLLPGIVHLTHIENTGAAFSMLSEMRWILVAVSAVASIFLVIAIIKTKSGALTRISLAFILGGAVGNLIDRLLFGSVVDMFVVDIVKFPGIFNVADIFVVVGCILFVIFYIFSSFKAPGKTKTKKSVEYGHEDPVIFRTPDAYENPETRGTPDVQEPPAGYSIDALLEEYYRENGRKG